MTDPKPAKVPLTLDQKIAAAQKLLSFRFKQQRVLQSGQKIILGGMMLSLAEDDPRWRAMLVDLLEKHLHRPIDISRMAPLLLQLKEPAVAKKEKQLPATLLAVNLFEEAESIRRPGTRMLLDT